MNNELIDKLGSQAQQSVRRQQLVDLDFLAKFAELIVKECTNLTLDHKSDDYYNGWLDYRDEIKKHFGVEE